MGRTVELDLFLVITELHNAGLYMIYKHLDYSYTVSLQ